MPSVKIMKNGVRSPNHLSYKLKNGNAGAISKDVANKIKDSKNRKALEKDQPGFKKSKTRHK